MSQTAYVSTDPAESKAARYSPKPPASLAEAGVSDTLAEQLILKNLYFRGEISGRDLARQLGFSFSVIEPILDFLKRARLVEVKRSTGFGNISSVFAASDAGRGRAKEYLENNQFLGPAPVPLSTYWDAVRQQTVEAGWMTKEVLERAFTGAIVTDEFYSKLGPAVNSFKSLLIYGRPGNGKSFLSEQLARLDSEPVYIPYAVEADGNIIKVFDSLYHKKVGNASESVLLESEPKYDQRWAQCKRPFLTTGGELTISMLDLMYIDSAKIYDAPYQLKAKCGMHLTPEAPTYSMRAHGGLPADAGGV